MRRKSLKLCPIASLIVFFSVYVAYADNLKPRYMLNAIV